MQSDTFDEVLGLEEQFYTDGFQQGVADGIKAGRVEGRTFGLEKGFEKYVESGRLYGKSLVWANRMAEFQNAPANEDRSQLEQASDTTLKLHDHQKPTPLKLPSLSRNQRLSKHLRILCALSESESLSTENTEESVSDYDDRLKRAQVKAKIIERMLGEGRQDFQNDGEMGSGH